MLLLAWTPLALAWHREPLPALPVERPVVLPRGWAMLDAGLEHLGGDDGARDTLRLSARYAAMRRVELRVAMPIVWARTGAGSASGPGDPELGARFRLHRSEPPNRSLAVDLLVRTPLGAAPEGIPLGADALSAEVGLVGGAQAGPFLGTLRLAVRDLAEAAVADPTLLLQVGPLFPFGAVHLELDPDGLSADGVGGLGLQLNRAIAVRGWLGAGRSGLSLEVGA